MDPLAVPTDVAGLWRPLTDAETTVAMTLIDYASRIVRASVQEIDERITAGTLDAELVAHVVASMVVRFMRNPDGKRSGTKSIDDYTTSWTYDQVVSSGHLVLLPAEASLLAPTRDTSRRPKAIRMTPALGLWL